MDNNKPTESKSLQTDLSDLLHSYISKWPLFRGINCDFHNTWCSILLYAPNTLRSTGKRAHYGRRQRSRPYAHVGLADFFSASASADAELEIIKSFTLYRNVVKELGLNTKYVIRKTYLSA